MSEAAPLRVLHVASEVFPLIKTGGLADVVAALPPAQVAHGADVRLLLPGLPPILDALGATQRVATLGPLFGAARAELRQGSMPGSKLPVYVLDAPYLYRRGGGPYEDRQGQAWPDNLLRFAALGWVGAHLAAGELDGDWQPDVLHAHDWHAAMSCAYVAAHPPTEAATVFTVHNLAYQGNFPAEDERLLALPGSFMSPAGLEYHGQLCFMKAGLKFADRVTTVSPTYAGEMATPEFGAGLDGVIRSRAGDVAGILNGIDIEVWNPADDDALAASYSADDLQGKAHCKTALQAEAGLAPKPEAPLLAVVSRLTPQKGLDLVLAVVPEIVRQGGQLVVQGTGDAALESAFAIAARAHPQAASLHVGYDEARAHRMIAGADVILVPSRFEPCGLTQLYGLRYGSLPLVRRVGGLADTVTDGETGFSFGEATPFALQACIERMMAAWHDRPRWQQMQQRGMAGERSWQGPAKQYLDLYALACASRRERPRLPQSG